MIVLRLGLIFVVVVFFKQKTAYEMRISDWSSDVCSSDLDDPALDLPPEERWSANIYGKKRDISGSMRAAVSELLVLFAVYGDRVLGSQVNPVGIRVDALVSRLLHAVEARKSIGRAACRDRVCKYV